MSDEIRILYVEDSEIDAELLKMCFKRYAFTKPIVIDVADTVQEAKDLFDIEIHSAALVDWNLPDGEGIEVVKFIRDMNQNIPLFILSGALSEAHEIEADNAKATAFIEKNYNKKFANYIYTFL
ncbi:response regulator [Pseudocolwellia sp. HL-MZ19]|uniref:response regulator n=1 Tax=Pseudocolwellia sp. HL-MZ19 TaxID=3400846 RepID=UPI003CE6C660